MAVSKVIEARAYFRERDTESPDSPRPHKRQRLQTPTLEDNSPQPHAWQERGCTPLPDIVQHDPPLLPTPAPAPPPADPIVSKAAHEALSAPWVGSTDFRYNDDDDNGDDDNNILKDTGDVGSGLAHPVPSPTEPESSDIDSDVDVDSDDARSSEPGVGGLLDIFETNADLNTAEYSEYTANSSY